MIIEIKDTSRASVSAGLSALRQQRDVSARSRERSQIRRDEAKAEKMALKDAAKQSGKEYAEPKKEVRLGPIQIAEGTLWEKIGTGWNLVEPEMVRPLAVAVDCGGAKQLGVFFLVQFQAGPSKVYNPFIPRQENGLPPGGMEKVVLIARLGSAGLWDLTLKGKRA